MNETLIREIADSIIRTQLLENWQLYAILGCLVFLTSVAGNWVGSYIKKRAETYATKADLQEVLEQIRATTNATEQVRVAVSHADWVSKEWKTIRRLKLEELLLTVYSLESWIDEQRSIWLFNADNKHGLSPIDKVEMVGSLYFPDLQAEIQAVVLAYRMSYMFIHDTAKKAKAVGAAPEAQEAIYLESVNDFKPLHRDTLLSKAALNTKAQEIMREMSS